MSLRTDVQSTLNVQIVEGRMPNWFRRLLAFMEWRLRTGHWGV